MELKLLFPMHLRKAMEDLGKLEDLEEIRVRIGQPLFLYTQQKELVFIQDAGGNGGGAFRESREKNSYDKAYRITEQDVIEIQNYISDYSLYAWQEELRNGFLTIQGGHRIGLAGGTTNQNGRISGISYLTFFNIRVAHEKRGCADTVLPYIRCSRDVGENAGRDKADIYNTLIVSPPGAGKTTLLRDCIRSLSYGKMQSGEKECPEAKAMGQCPGKKVGIVDERSEIAASYHGIPQNDVGPRTDVLDGCNKPEGIQLLLRTMSPEIIAVDELGTEEDFKAAEQAAYSGCRVIGTVHAGGVEELWEKPNLRKWCEKGLFERFVLLEKGEGGIRRFKIYNNRWELLC